MSRRVVLAILSSALMALSGVADAGGETLVQGSSAQHTLAVSLAGDAVVARACRFGAPCRSDGGEQFPWPPGAMAQKAKIETVELAGDKRVALVTVPLTGGGSWVVLLAASSPPEAPSVQKALTGTLDQPKGAVEGERATQVLLRESTPDGTRLVVGKRYEHATVCGRPAVMGARELDPSDMTWLNTGARSLGAADVAGATAVSATKMSTPFLAGAPQLLNATVASSAVGRTREGMTDGNLATRWAEGRPEAGQGELISMTASEDIGITGFEVVVRPPDAPAGAAPRTFFIATDKKIFRVTMPGDAWQEEPGTTYEITLPEPVRTDCVTVVLDEAHLADGRDEVGFAEIRARTVLDGKSHAELVELLRGDSPEADAAKALLARSGDPGVLAAMSAFDSLDRLGRARALDVVESGTCTQTTEFYVDRLLGRGHDLKDFDPDLEPLAQRARDQLRGCRSTATGALEKALRAEAPGPRRIWAARELADIEPVAAITAILDVMAEGSTAPKQPGSADSVRRGLRSALSVAVQHRRAESAVRAQLGKDTFAKLSTLLRVDLLRALGPATAKLAAQASGALALTLADDSSFRTRYLLIGPAARLAAVKDAPAAAFIEKCLADKNAHLRAQAASASAAVPSMADQVARALADRSPRVREAALTGIAEAGKLTAATEKRAVSLLGNDRWTFVREAAALALARTPRKTAAGSRANQALIAALDDEAPGVRRAALRALGDRKAIAAGERIHEIADNPKETVHIRTAAIAALGALCRQDSADLLYKLAIRAGFQELPYDQPLGLAALAALGELKPPDLQTRLAPLLSRKGEVPPLIRAIARDALARPGSCRK